MHSGMKISHRSLTSSCPLDSVLGTAISIQRLDNSILTAVFFTRTYVFSGVRKKVLKMMKTQRLSFLTSLPGGGFINLHHICLVSCIIANAWCYLFMPTIGYYCSGPQLTLVVISRPVRERGRPIIIDLAKVDLRLCRDCIANIWHLINLTILFKPLTDLVQAKVAEFQPIEM